VSYVPKHLTALRLQKSSRVVGKWSNDDGDHAQLQSVIVASFAFVCPMVTMTGYQLSAAHRHRLTD